MKFEHNALRLETSNVDSTLPMMWAVHDRPAMGLSFNPPTNPYEVMYLGENPSHWLLVVRREGQLGPNAVLVHAPKSEYKLYGSRELALSRKMEYLGSIAGIKVTAS